jgi:uncharacterized protein YutE (UPF0331/DUF86 family)
MAATGEPPNRPPVAARARRGALDEVLAQLARTMEQLESAIRVFPPQFNLAAFADAWRSGSPELRNRAMLVRSNMDDLHNLCNTLIALSVRVAQDSGAIPADRRTPVGDQLKAQRLYSKGAEEVMREVADLRNSSQHEYWVLEPEQVHAAVNRQRQHLPSFIADVGAWIESLTDRRA